jgi:hypothetical protein
MKKRLFFSLLIGLVILTLLLTGCGGSKTGKGGGDDDFPTIGDDDFPTIIDFDAEAYEGTAWRCAASENYPEITVYIDEIVDKDEFYHYYRGSVESPDTGTINITGEGLSSYIALTATEFYGMRLITFLVSATGDEGDQIQINGVIDTSKPNTVIVAYLVFNDYEYDDETSSEIIKFIKL